MEQPIVTIMPSVCTDFDGMETFGKELLVHIEFLQEYYDIQSLKVRVFNEYFMFCAETEIGCGFLNSLRCADLPLVTDSDWLPESFSIFVYFDGLPCWEGKFELSTDPHEMAESSLDAIDPDGYSRFFLDQLADNEYWRGLAYLDLPFEDLNGLLHTLYDLSKMREADPSARLPHVFVRGERNQADHFAIGLSSLIQRNGSEPLIVSHLDICHQDITIKPDEYECVLVQLYEKKAAITMEERENWSTFIRNIREGYFGKTTFVISGWRKLMRLWELFCPDMRRIEGALSFDLPECPDWVSDQRSDDEEDEFDSAHPFTSGTTGMKLEEMVGLTRVKAEIESAGTMAMFLKRRQEMGLEKNLDCRYHMLFLGNPGTGKTTVAKLIGEMFYEMGLLTRGHTVEVNRTTLVGEYIGQTEKRTAKVIEEARGGVLFIDEAYSLADGSSRTNDYGKEVIHALLPVLSEPNPNMIVIMAGYEDKMKWLLESNQGLKDRFPLSFHFDDYTAEELLDIALRLAQSRGFAFSDKAKSRLREVILRATAHRDEHFGNGRWIHNLMEQGILKAMAKRVMVIDRKHLELDLTHSEMVDLFTLIEESDIKEAEKMWAHQSSEKLVERRRIGFARG